MNELKISQSDAKTPAELSALLRAHHGIKQLAISLEEGVYPIEPTREWNDENDVALNPGFRFGPQWTLDGRNKATLKVDFSTFSDDRIDATPLKAIQSTELRFDKERLNLHEPEEAWELYRDFRGQAVRNLTIDLSYKETVDRWRAQGIIFRIGAIALAGHQAASENVHVTNYGAYKYEGFPIHIQAAYGMYDRNLIARTDPATHIFDSGLSDKECSHITDCPVDGYDEAGSYDPVAQRGYQITARLIAGNVGQNLAGEWIQHYRAYCYHTGNRTRATGSNLVQAHTIYQSLRGLIAKNDAECAVLVYGDTYSSRGIVVDDNDHKGYHSVQLLLGPGGVCPEQTSHDDYTILGTNRFQTNGPQVKLDTLAAQYEGPPTDRRHIRGIKVDEKFDVQASPDVEWSKIISSPAVLKKRGGCGSRFF